MSAPTKKPSPPTAGARGKARRTLLLRWSAGIATLALLAWLLPFEEISGAITRVPVSAWAFSLPAYLALHLVGATKWRLLLGAAGGGLPWIAAVRCHYYGLFGGTFLPSMVGGEVFRVGLALRLARSPEGVIVGTAAERILDVLSLGAIAGLGVLLLPQALDGPAARVVTFLIACGAVGLVVLILCLPLLGRAPRRLKRLLVRVRRPLRAMAAHPWELSAALTLAIGMQALLVLLNAFLGKACGLDLPFRVWLFAWPLAKLSGLVPLTQGGLGVREAAQAALLAPLGVSAAPAVAAGLAFRAVILVGGLAAGAIGFLLRYFTREPDATA